MGRRIIIILIGLLVLIAIAAVVYVLVRGAQSSDTTPETTTQEGVGDQLPQEGEGGDLGSDAGSDNTDSSSEENVAGDDSLVLRKIIDADVKGPTLSTDENSVLFFNVASNQFFSAGTDGSNPQPFNDTQFVNVEDVKFSPNKTQAILSFPNANSKVLQKYFYDLEKDLAIKLNENIDSFAFSPEGSKIFYKYSDALNDINTFNIANANGTDWRSIKDFSVANAILDWPTEDKLAFHLTPSSFRQGAYYTFDLDGENVISILPKAYGVDGVWSKDGSRLLASTASERTINLSLTATDLDGSERINIPNSKTFVQKCVWMNDSVSVICAVPSEIDRKFYLPDDYLAGNFSTDDTFFRYNTKTGERIELRLHNAASGDEVPELPQIDAYNLFLSSDELVLYFQNKADDNSLYRLRLDP